MKKNKFHTYGYIIGLALSFIGCEQHEITQVEPAGDTRVMKFALYHPDQSLTRVTETGFEANDQVGISITRENEGLQISGNYVNNSSLKYDGQNWQPAKKIYWEEGSYNVYACHPFLSSISSINEQSFKIRTDQHTAKTDSTLSGYEASDFLWAIAEKQTATEQAIPLRFKHCMSKLVIRLVKSADNPNLELPEDTEVYIHNTVTDATIDLSAGVATKNPDGKTQTIRAKHIGNHQYTAIVVPQRILTQRPLVEVVTQGVSYMVDSRFVFKPGIQHMLSFIIARNPDQVKIEIGGEIEHWTPSDETVQ